MSSFYRHLIALAALTAFWLMLTGADPKSLVLGVPTVFLAYASFIWLFGRTAATSEGAMRCRGVKPTERTLSLRGLALFVPFFLRKALLGGIDVAGLALSSRKRINPGFSLYQTRLRRADALHFFIFSINLLPGTLTVRRLGEQLELHALVAGEGIHRELAELERATERIFPSVPVLSSAANKAGGSDE